MKIRFTRSARGQLLGALEYIRHDDATAAVKVLLRVEKAVARLKTFPQSGRRIPEFPALPHRELVVAPFRLFYRVDAQELWIVAVWHSAQSPTEPPD